MKFRKDEGGIWEVLIDEEWHGLCACKTCGEVHAGNSYKVDKKIKCCEKPDNWRYSRNHLIEKLIDEFVKKWSDEE